MLSSNLRGGMSFASERYAESAVFEDISNVPRTRDQFQRFNLIQYIDANALYASAQIFPLPYADLKFLDEKEFIKIDWLNVDLMGAIGYFVEVCLLYPKNIHEKTASYPLCPENIEITFDMLSPYQKKVLFSLFGKTNYKATKLTATFFDKNKIVLHALNLQQYLKLGMKIKKVHRVIQFKQKPFMADWITFCTNKRSQSKNSFEKNYWKLIPNCIFGKSIEGVENRKNVIICTDSKQFARLVKSPYYERHVIVNSNLSIVIHSKIQTKLIRPYYMGFSILEISKFIMYNFFYDILQPYFGVDGCRVLYQDTDSFVLSLKTTNIFTDLKNLENNMDFSNVHQSHPLFSEKNKTQLFKFKEEFGLRPISRFCALKAKCYSFEIPCNHVEGMDKLGNCRVCKNKITHFSNINKLKGIQQSTARQIHFEKYVNCLKSIYCQRNSVHQITSKAQSISSVFLSKISLSSFDDKRFLLNCGVHSRPYGGGVSPFCSICEM